LRRRGHIDAAGTEGEEIAGIQSERSAGAEELNSLPGSIIVEHKFRRGEWAIENGAVAGEGSVAPDPVGSDAKVIARRRGLDSHIAGAHRQDAGSSTSQCNGKTESGKDSNLARDKPSHIYPYQLNNAMRDPSPWLTEFIMM
jgi:hypothetical protein